MNLLVIGDEDNAEECRQKFGATHSYIHKGSTHDVGAGFDSCDVVFDFLPEPGPDSFECYNDVSAPVFFNTSKISLLQLLNAGALRSGNHRFGFAGLPSFLNREVLEVSLHRMDDRGKLETICGALGTAFQTVEDRVGLVTPRVICMIINEAYCTVEEGTASREDVDLAMKLGTNYPFGPFEWCRKIGIRHVYELLKAVYADTQDERYAISPLLERECSTQL